MKKITILSIAFIAISLASCTKDYTCTCELSNTAPGSPTQEVKVVFHKVSASTAQAACVSTNILPSGETTYETTDCTLK